jgi:starch synthase
MKKKDKLSILVASSEAAPLAQAGGLGDVAGSLPLVFRDLGHRVAVVLPAYQQVLEKNHGSELAAKDLPVRLGRVNLTADILVGELGPGVPAYLVKRDEFFDRSELYGSSQGEYPDNRERFIFFSRSIPALCEAVGFVPDVILGNDWQTGLVMALLAEGAMPQTAGVFAIHNLGYLGLVPPEQTDNIGLPERYYTPEGLEYFGQMSLL